jgi:hypothetical protein
MLLRPIRGRGRHVEETYRPEEIIKLDEDAPTSAIVQLASRFGRYGYRRVTGLLREAGWRVNKKRVESFNGKLRDELLNREIFYTSATT